MQEILCNKYEVIRPLAGGSQGSVFLAEDKHLGRLVAVKVYQSDGGELQQEQISREREMLKNLSHPSLVQVLDFFRQDGKAYLVMEYVEGITLTEYLTRFGPAQTPAAVNWCLELADVLGYLHAQNPPIIYRDLKPDNIMIRRDGKIKLIDFGTATSPDYGREKSRELTGTPGYSAPEQWQPGKADKRSDIYALGAVLHEMLTGVRPVQALYERRPVREYNRSISPEIEKIVKICTMENPEKRYHAMSEVKEALKMYKKKDLRSSILFLINQFLSVALWGLFLWVTLLPLLKGVPENEFLFPYLLKTLILLAAAIGYRRFFLWRSERDRFVKKMENSVFLTQKRFPGMDKDLLFLLFLVMQVAFLALTVGPGMPVKAGEEPGTLWVDMRDEENRKLLVKEGCTYQVKERLRFDIPKENLPKGKVFVRILASGEQGELLESRVFLVEGN